jgi:rhodanese-related sulfurtransferase
MKKSRSFFNSIMIAVLLVSLVSIYGCSAAGSPIPLVTQPPSETLVVQITTETPVVPITSETQVALLTTETPVVPPTSETQVALIPTLTLVSQPTPTTPITQSTTTTPVVQTTTTTAPVVPPTAPTTTTTVTQMLPTTANEVLLANVRSKAEQPSPGIYDIDAAAAKNLVDNTPTIILDARYLVDYNKLHLAGAISLPVSSVWQNFIDPVTVIPDKDAILIAYCAPGCPAGLELAQELAARGYHNLFVLLGGYLYWQEAGYPMVIKS